MRVPNPLRCILLLVLILAPAASARSAETPRRPPVDEARRHAIRSRTLVLTERQAHARTRGGVPLDSLSGAMAELAAEARAAGLDTAAASLSMRAGTLYFRQGRRSEAEQRMSEAIADALRAKDVLIELSARLYLLDWAATRRPEVVLRAVRDLEPRVRRRPEASLRGDLYGAQSAALMHVGRAKEALVAAKRAAAGYRKSGSAELELAMLMRASQALRFLNRHAEALAMTDSIFAMAKHRPLGAAVTRAWLERASSLVTLGRYDEAFRAYDEALSNARRLGDVPRRVTAHRFRARLFLSTHRYRECIAEVDSLIPFLANSQDRTLDLTCAELRGASLIELGRAAEAETILSRALDEYENWLAGLPGFDQATTAEINSTAYTILARSHLVRGQFEAAWRAAERGRSRALKRRLGLPDVPDLAGLRRELARTRSAMVQFDDCGGGRGNVFLISGERMQGWTLEHGLTVTEVRGLMRNVSEPPSSRATMSAHRILAGALLDRVWKELPSGIERLVIVPPFDAEALLFEAADAPASAELARVGDRWMLGYVPAAGLMPIGGTEAPPGRGLVVVAAPEVYLDAPTSDLLGTETRQRLMQPLPSAREEAKRFASGARRVLTGRDASLQRIAAESPCGWLHLATHAIENTEASPEGALVLAGSPSLVTPSHVDSLRLSADLVTLSGCRTLGSKSYGAEGVIGLARAFLATGARTVITTRWDVGDRAAARFMEVFRAELIAGASRDVAFTRAGRRLEREGFPARDRWAFQLLGAGAPGLPAGVSTGLSPLLGRFPGLPK